MDAKNAQITGRQTKLAISRAMDAEKAMDAKTAMDAKEAMHAKKASVVAAVSLKIDYLM